MLDHDLAKLYDIETKVLKQAVSRNIDRFPADFLFELTNEEYANLRSQFVTSSWGGSRYPPIAFTEQGLPCCQVFLIVNKPLRSISRLCGCLPGSGRY
ncbi:MAG TPA: ORF6N domain-containing protein [Bacteroidales bacterium]|nr:ORF6N domain-containing protein [Bacteroidales bacterium]